MTDRDAPPLLTQEALNRLTADRGDEFGDRTHRLGRLVQRNLDLAIANPETCANLGISMEDGMGNSVTKEQRVGNRQSAFLQFGIPPQFQELEGTAAWLSHTERVRLRMNIYDVDLPEGIDMQSADFDIPDPVAELEFYLTPALASRPEAGIEPRVATYEDGLRADHQDTETIIGVLTLLAERTSAEQSGSTPA